ncbi:MULTISPECIES: hypothetical protein [Amycolatopsis]|uniref:Uncharacterized protein n=1 Tax=Amycolatopsis bullii TaxID=941987 RepID=A0ABQ3KSI3_9PSEU|nr:hypothetical protein [Amycolatopsis bullii]GHG49811.1 hypothetical protein GCM10017567_85720 [Amycolatopsis bullii]
MDEDYARKLRNWLRAEPGATPSGASEEREWLRGIPEPASEEQADTPDRWTVRGQLPQTPADDDWVCPVIALPVPRSSRENGCRMSGVEVRVRWERPANADRMSDAEARSRWSHPTNAGHRAQTSDPTSDAEARSRSAHPANANPMTDAEARSRWNHPTNADRRAQAPGPSPTTETEALPANHSTETPSPMTEAEARSRWNHPTNWHRRRRAAAEDRRRDQPGSR